MSSNADLTFLLNQIASGDKAAFAGFYREMERPVYRFIASKLKDPHEAADLLHDVFMEIWRNADKFEGRSPVKTYVFGIAYRKVMDFFRKHGRVDLTDEFSDESDDAPNPEACLAASQEADHLRFCLDQLRPKQAATIKMAFYQDMSYPEIAAATDVPEGTIKTRIYHAKQLLLRCLSGRMQGQMA